MNRITPHYQLCYGELARRSWTDALDAAANKLIDRVVAEAQIEAENRRAAGIEIDSDLLIGGCA